MSGIILLAREKPKEAQDGREKWGKI